MVKKEKSTKKKVIQDSDIKKSKDVVEEEPTEVEESLTIKQKKENAKKLEKRISKMNAKIKKSLEKKQIIKAVKALKDYIKSAKSANQSKKLLEEEDDSVVITFTLAQVPTKPTPKPQQIQLPHPFNSADNNTRACVFVKDPAREFKDQIQDLNIPTIAKVIEFSKLKKEFRQFKDKRQLLKDFDIFLADLRIYKMLPELLGKEFYLKKKYPCPVKLHGFSPKELQKQLNKVSSSAFFIQGNGPNYSIKVGRTNQDEKLIAENIEAALPQALAYVTVHDKIKFSKVQNVTVKIGTSPELPIFNQLQAKEVAAYFENQQ